MYVFVKKKFEENAPFRNRMFIISNFFHSTQIVPWLDGEAVKLCPNCVKRFYITRRQHHCRLCGSIMCHDCSLFLSLSDAGKALYVLSLNWISIKREI